MLKLGFIGSGTVGSALALRLAEKGYPVAAVSSRTHISAERLARIIPGCLAATDNQTVADKAELVFITTPDDTIVSIVSEVKWRPGQSVVHCSGADSTDILEPARRLGAQVGAFHPLQTFASVQRAIENLPGSIFTIEAEKPLLTVLKDMAKALNGYPLELKAGDKVLYHAAAVMACNYLVTLVKTATDLWQKFDVPPQEATRALLPLLRGTINNIENIGIPGCLTGPVARGDTGTIKKHLNALEETAPELLNMYRELGRQTISVALEKGRIDERQAEILKAIFAEPSPFGRLRTSLVGGKERG